MDKKILKLPVIQTGLLIGVVFSVITFIMVLCFLIFMFISTQITKDEDIEISKFLYFLILGPIGSFFMSFISGCIFAFIYNKTVKFFDGIKISFQDEE